MPALSARAGEADCARASAWPLGRDGRRALISPQSSHHKGQGRTGMKAMASI